MTIPLFIPYVNRPDLLEKSIRSADCRTVEINIANNSNKPLPGMPGHFVNCQPPVPLTFAQTQNWFIKIAETEQQPFYLWMHSDAEAVGDTVQRLVAMANAYTIQKRKWGVIFTNYDALAAFNTAAFQEVGGWDQELSWYASDCDSYRRIRLAGYEIIESGLPVKHEPSQTLKADPEIRRRVDLMFPYRVSYYRAKWGSDPGHEIFDKPFDAKAY